MREFEKNFPDWKTQVESAIFYPGRKGDVNTTGKQFTVYTLPNIDFVVKIPQNPMWMNGYRLVEELAPDCAVPFMEVADLKLNINRIKSTIPKAIVQIKVAELVSEIENIYRTRNVDRFIQIAKGQMDADRKLFSAGIFVPDSAYTNFGIDKEGDVKTFDLGSARTSFSDDEEYSNLARARGHVHFSTYLFLQTIEKDLEIPSTDPNRPSELYGRLMNLPPAHPKGATLDEIISRQDGSIWDPDLSMYLAEVGHQEFVNFAPNGAPFEINETFIRGLPDSLRSKEGPNFF